MGLERLLTPWPESRVVCDDDRLIVIDKLPGIPVHGGDEAAGDDLVGRLRARDLLCGKQRYLGVHQRLDKQVSGLIFFNRDPSDNAKLAHDARERLTRRHYVALVKRTPGAPELPASGKLEQWLLPEKGGRTRVVTRGGQRAVTHFEVLERRLGRTLVALSLETGRKHQIRAQLAHAGAPVVGDELYGGEPAPRLMLHCVGLELRSLERRFSSEPPAYLRCWLNSGGLELDGDFERLIEDAACLRWRTAQTNEAWRLVNDQADLLPGVSVDVYGGHCALSVSTDAAFGVRQRLAESLVELGVTGVYLKTRARTDLRRKSREELAPPEPIAGLSAPPRFSVSEGDMKLEIALADGLSTGLFVDQRDNRLRVRQRSEGRRVLNLFAYTCSFSVAAALGGAAEVVSVDLSKRALARGKRNFELNGIDPGRHRFIADDAVKWLPRSARKQQKFELIVVDPPSFASHGKGTFSVETGYLDLIESVLRVLAPGGELLAVTNHKKTSSKKLVALLELAARRVGRNPALVKSMKSGVDCAAGGLGPEPSRSAWLVLP